MHELPVSLRIPTIIVCFACQRTTIQHYAPVSKNSDDGPVHHKPCVLIRRNLLPRYCMKRLSALSSGISSESMLCRVDKQQESLQQLLWMV